MKPQPFRYCIDTPQPEEAIATPFLLLAGWIVSEQGQTISNPTLVGESRNEYPLMAVPRPDVEAAFPNSAVLGFQQYLSIAEGSEGKAWDIRFLLDDKPYHFEIPWSPSPGAAKKFRQQKRDKLEKIREILRCPICDSDRLQESGDMLSCQDCSAEFSFNPSGYNFLNRKLSEYGKVKPTANVSANEYDPIAIGIIEQFPDGLILDNGSGLRRIYYDNVVNFEIVDYPTTDVIGIGEKLPFKSDVFDAVFSLSVLEHVKNPFECAKEIYRVLKPGGKLYVSVPFLQPFHGYPDHYYNMTSSGLKNLFPELQIIESGVPVPGLPIWSLSWFLNSYLRGLPSDVSKKLKNMKISELLDSPIAYLKEDFVRQLSPEVNEELAACNYIIAKK